MNINPSLFKPGEQAIFTLRALYDEYGYSQYKMNKFEEYDLYVKNKDFLISDNIISFTDTNGKLMALRPDVTLSIIKGCRNMGGGIKKLYYNESIYRVSESTHSFSELMQTGLECIGSIGTGEKCEVLLLAAKSLEAFDRNFVLQISQLGILEKLVKELDLPEEKVSEAWKAIGEKNLAQLNAICRRCNAPEQIENTIIKLISFCGSPKEVLGDIAILLGYSCSLEIAELAKIAETFEASGYADKLRIDFSLTGNTNYYNGIAFKGFVRTSPDAVLSGGEYNHLLKKMDCEGCAIGFAVYLDKLVSEKPESDNAKPMINVALPKGRLGDKVYDLFERAGFECPSIKEQNRKLIFENEEAGVRYFWVKPSDVAIYVERGAADIGVCGKDILLESSPNVYELLDLNLGKCTMCVAAKEDFVDDPSQKLKIATKFSNIAASYYREQGRDIDIIHLNGSIEIAPILGLSDVIVDIVETGTTLKENKLHVVEKILPISARLIANKSAYQFKTQAVDKVVRELAKLVDGDK